MMKTLKTLGSYTRVKFRYKLGKRPFPLNRSKTTEKGELHLAMFVILPFQSQQIKNLSNTV